MDYNRDPKIISKMTHTKAKEWNTVIAHTVRKSAVPVIGILGGQERERGRGNI